MNAILKNSVLAVIRCLTASSSSSSSASLRGSVSGRVFVRHASRASRSLITIQVGEASAANLDSDLFKLNSGAVIGGVVTKQQELLSTTFLWKVVLEAFMIKHSEEKRLQVHFSFHSFLIFLVGAEEACSPSRTR